VEPPNAAFLVQLFLVPGIIVAIIVCVWLAFHWLAHMGSDPQAYVKTLRRDNEGRWQAALNLANDLRGPGGAALKNDEGLATELGRILGIGPEARVAAGDHLNDLPMLRREFGHYLACPSNSIAEVLEAVRNQNGYVASREAGAGIAEALRLFFP